MTDLPPMFEPVFDAECELCAVGYHDEILDHSESEVTMVIEDLSTEWNSPQVDEARGRCHTCFKHWDAHPGWIIDPITRSDPNYKPACYIGAA